MVAGMLVGLSSPLKSLIVLLGAFLAALAWAGSAAAQSEFYPPSPDATCRTLDSRGEPATLFAPGDQIAVSGTNFSPRMPVAVGFVQGLISRKITEIPADDAGAFTTDPAAARLPSDARAGAASVRAIDGEVSATCAIQISLDATLRSDAGDTQLMALWVFLLLIFGSFLSTVSWRRWRSAKLVGATGAGPVLASPRSDTAVPFVDTVSWRPRTETRRSRGSEDLPLLDLDDLDDLDPGETARLDDPKLLPPRNASSTVRRLLKDTKGWESR